MPKLHGYRERVSFNEYDALFLFAKDKDSTPGPFLSPFAETSSHVLFGNANIGYVDRSNRSIPSGFGDCTAFISNLYARTSLPPSQVFTDWAHTTTVALTIGGKRMLSMSMADVLRRVEKRDLLPGSARPESDIALDADLAREAWHACQRELGKNILDLNEAWAGLSPLDRDTWHGVAHAVRMRLSLPQFLVVPVRQSMWVVVEQNLDAARALMAEIDTSPVGPGLWIHLEGFMSRDHG